MKIDWTTLPDTGLNRAGKQKHEFGSFIPGSRNDGTLLGSVEWFHSLPGSQDAWNKAIETLFRLAKLCLGIKQFNKLVLIVVLFWLARILYLPGLLVKLGARLEGFEPSTLGSEDRCSVR